MKAQIISLAMLFSVCVSATAQADFKFNQKYAKSAVNVIFYAAQSGNFDMLYTLCDPNGYSDRDSKRICSITQLADTIAGTDASENAKENLAEFITIFESGKITGDITYSNDGETEYAEVPIWYNHPQGESRSFETLTLVKRTGKWYLFSF